MKAGKNMANKVIVPQIGPQMKKGILVSWEKQDGDHVNNGDVLYEIETDKVVSQVEAEAEGILCNITAEEGDEVFPGTVIAEIESEA